MFCSLYSTVCSAHCACEVALVSYEQKTYSKYILNPSINRVKRWVYLTVY